MPALTWPSHPPGWAPGPRGSPTPRAAGTGAPLLGSPLSWAPGHSQPLRPQFTCRDHSRDSSARLSVILPLTVCLSVSLPHSRPDPRECPCQNLPCPRAVPHCLPPRSPQQRLRPPSQHGARPRPPPGSTCAEPRPLLLRLPLQPSASGPRLPRCPADFRVCPPCPHCPPALRAPRLAFPQSLPWVQPCPPQQVSWTY